MLRDQAPGELEEETKGGRNHIPCPGLGVRELREEARRSGDAVPFQKGKLPAWCLALYTSSECAQHPKSHVKASQGPH